MSNLRNNVVGRAKLSNKVSLNAFDLSHRNVFTSSCGQLLPVSAVELLPNEKVTIKPTWFTRAQPLKSDSFGRLIENVQSVFVPYSALWRFASQTVLSTTAVGLNGQAESRSMIDGNYAASKGTKLPYVYLSDIYAYLTFFENFLFYYVQAVGNNVGNFGEASLHATFVGNDLLLRSISAAKMLSYMGYGSFKEVLDPQYRNTSKPLKVVGSALQREIVIYPLTSEGLARLNKKCAAIYEEDMAINIMRLLAYHKVYNDYYRNDVWQEYSAHSCNVDFIIPSEPYYFSSQYFPNFDESLCASVSNEILKFSQLVDTDKIVQEYNAFVDKNPNFWYRDNMFDLRVSNLQVDAVNGVVPAPQYGSDSRVDVTVSSTDSITSNSQIVTSSYNKNSDGYPKIFPLSLSTAPVGFSIKDLRVAQSLQKFKEIAASNSNDYTSQVLAHFGVAPSDDIYRSYFVGGTSSVMQVDTQVNSNLAEDNAAVRGGIASANGSYSCSYKSNTYGVLLTIYRIVPLVDYGNDGLCEQITTTSVDSLPIPELDSNGFVNRRSFRSVDYCTIQKTNAAEYEATTHDDVIGYTVPYFDYKVAPDVVNGNIMFTDSNRVLGRSADGLSINESNFKDMPQFFRCVPQNLDSVFVNNNHALISDDQFYTNMQVGVSALRPMSVHGLPFAN